MIVTMHQPEHLPWLGYFHKMALADLYVIMDTVQYRHQYFQNRNRILGSGGPLWVNVPVRKLAHRYGPIGKVTIDNTRTWQKTYWGQVNQHYHHHPFFATYGPDLQAIIMSPFESLAELNLVLIDFFREHLGITTPMVRCSAIGSSGAKGDLILQACEEIGAECYLSGPFGRDYLDEEPFAASGIRVAYHEFEHPTYAQFGCTEFTPNLSTLDLLMNHGPESAGILKAVKSSVATPVREAMAARA